jgi:hypothetical protein
MTAHGAAEVVAEVKALEGFQTTPVEHVRAIEEIDFAILMKLVRVIADGTVFLLPCSSLITNGLPELIKHLFFLLPPLVLLPRPLSSLLPYPRHIRKERVKERICVFDALVHALYAPQNLLPFLSHGLHIAPANAT